MLYISVFSLPWIYIVLTTLIFEPANMIYYQFIDLYYTSLAFLTVSLYNSSAIGLIKQLYYHHRHEFLGHIKSLIGLFFASELSLIPLGCIQGYLSLVSFCVTDDPAFNNNPEFNGICKFLTPS